MRRLSVLAVAAIALAACGGTPTKTVAVRGELVGSARPVSLGSVTPTGLGESDTAFGLRLLADVCAKDPTANTVLSPASAAQALGLLSTAARGDALTSLSSLLHQPAYGPDVVAAQHERTQQLHAVKELSTSNRFFVQQGVQPEQQTLDDLKTGFDTSLSTLDFAKDPSGSTAAINRAVSDDTKGLVPSLLDMPLDPLTVAVLTNAVYLKADWQQPFAESSPAPFTTASGASVQAALMSEGGDATYTAADGWQAAAIPYAGGSLVAHVLLPPEGTDPSACTVPAGTTLGTLMTRSAVPSDVALPSFHLTQTHELLGTLAEEGLQPGGDYSGLGSADVGISDVVQKVDVAVDQQGTTAAAATGIVGVATAARVPQNPVVADRPFLLLITDTASGTPLFLLRVADPR